MSFFASQIMSESINLRGYKIQNFPGGAPPTDPPSSLLSLRPSSPSQSSRPRYIEPDGWCCLPWIAVGPAGHSGVTAATVRISEDKVRDLQMWSCGWYYRLATGWVNIYNKCDMGKCNGNTKYGLVFLQEAWAWTSMHAVWNHRGSVLWCWSL